MKKIISASLVVLAAATGFLLNNQPVEAHRRYNYRRYPYSRGYPYYRRYPYPIEPARYCFPTTQWQVNQDPGYHPHAYSDGYRQGQNSAKKGDKYKPRTAGGEFARGFDDGYYGKEFAGQKNIVQNVIRPYTTTECSLY
ncbi:hypothetical protein H6G81_17275 [Scytonema hofmannii FACHB-248]|uniref:Uncharacterized protein n=1 Tax=Scytonema hofmannii FACHB-248 TaxID=1842502 RepID=A0ABR8GSP7_9CYAN|nr:MULTISPECIES: hypothetical protein [Nostocales]MBD2606232.1 hypothetical protein [Scytonema hofmannii FACHB-248]